MGQEKELSRHVTRRAKARYCYLHPFLKVQLLTLVHSPRKRSSLPLRVEGPLQRLHAARQLFQPRMVDDQDAVEMVELVLEGPRRLPAEGYCEGHAGDVLRLHLDHLST